MSLIVDKFITTNQSKQRIQKIIDGIQSGIPVLLVGPTGTSKTRSAKMACDIINQKCVTLNFSSQTKIEDLLGQMARNTDQFGGFSFKKGPYSEAYEKGHCLILDEINLAHESVLQSIEASLDLGYLSFDAPGVGTEVIPMNSNFHIIATQNPLTGRFSQKRQFLSEKFLSRFLVINFNDIQKEELLEIAAGLAEGKIPNKTIQKIVNFHFLFQKKEINEIHVFTIREIASTIQSILNGYTPYESLLYHYASRYDKKKYPEIKKLFDQCKIKEAFSENKLNLRNYHQKLFCVNNEVSNVFNCAWSILRDCHPILLIGPDGCGKTSFARWIGSLIPIRENSQNPTKLFVCNQEMTISDIIGRYMPIKNTNIEEEDAPIRWINGPIIDAIKNGEVLILDQIDTAPSTILERLNSLYDGLGSSNFTFTVQENPEESEVRVHQHFRIIATASEKGLNDLSPAFLNRFTIIYINDQVPEIFTNKQTMAYATFFANQFVPNSLINKLNAESNKMTISRFAKVIRGFSTIKKKFKTANDNDIINFLFSVTDQNVRNNEESSLSKTKYNEPVVSENFASILLDSLDDKVIDEKNDEFYFKEASSTRKVMATLVACSLIGQHVIMIGKTGLGKTAAAMAFARMSTFSNGQQMISFNGETQLEELFGFFTIEKGNFTLHNGPLSNAMINGQVFIADELNLAEQQIIQSLNVAVEPMKNETITVPVVGSNVKVDPGFFFIGCQNDITMFGRRPLPESFKKKVLCLEYPEPSPGDLFNLTKEISKQFDISNFESQCTVDLIEKMKNHPLFRTKPWSLREVRKLFRRTYYSRRHQDSFIGIKIYHHAAFLLRSSFRSESEVSRESINLISIAFKLKDHEKNGLLNDIESKVEVKFTDDNRVMINKGSLTIYVIQNTLNTIPEDLQSFWQLFFEANLAHFAEPLLLVGPSGFKTFLAKMLLPLSPPVYLHNDSTTSSLIGQIALLDKYQAKLFLLDSLRMFVGINPIGDLFNEIRTSIESDDLKRADLDNLIHAIKDKAPESFGDIIDTIGENIIALDKNEQSSSLFSNYASIFKPGLITRAIFEQNSLILKNIAQPSPTVLERFNELLSVTPTLTLFEDTSNTFTPENSKVLFNFSQRFRIIGICLPHEKHGLSDAMLSRLTEINVPSYTDSEKSLVYSVLMKNDPKTFSYSFDSLMAKASEIFKITFDIDLSFALSIQIAKITTKWSIYYQSKDMTKDIKTLFAYALFRCAGGYLLSDTEERSELIKAMNQTELRLPESFSKLFEETENIQISNDPYIQITNNQGTELLESTLTGFSADTVLGKLPKTSNLMFTTSFSDLIDLVISMADILQPLLIEGESGCGKSSAVSYVADCVGAKVINISISQSTTIEDLFGKVEPSSNSDSLKFDFIETDLLHALRADREDAYKTNWIVIEELHLASAAVLDALAAVFNPESEQIWLPNGDYVNKGRFFIIGLLSKPISHQAIVNTAVYYKANNYSQEEFCSICTNILKNEDYGFTSDEFCDKIVKLDELTSNSNLKVPITAREAYKFIRMMKASNNLIMPEQVMEMLFLGRFLDEDSQANAKKEIYSKDANSTSVVPYITIQNNATVLNSGDAKIQIGKNYKYHKNIKSLTVSQRQLFQFMTLSINSNIPLVVQGPTSSGKTYIINLFANIVGQKLRVIQLNSETTSASIAGNYQPSSTLNENEYTELSNYLKLLSNSNILPINIRSKINQKQIKNWNPNEFREVRNILSQQLNKCDRNIRSICEQYIRKADSALQFFNHLTRKDSTIVECLVNGDWLLLDGIESAPADLFDRLFTLLDDEPTLNLYERGKGFIYSKNATNKKYKISDNFRLFMTYNPTNTKSSSISPAFLSRCSLFTLNPIDSSIIDSTLAISGLIQSMRFELDDNPLKVAVKLANIHSEAKKYVQDDPSIFFNGRTLIHLCRSLRHENNTKEIITNKCLYNMVKKHYCQSSETLWNSEDFYQQLIEPLSKPVKKKVLKAIDEIRLVSSKHCIALTNIIESFKQSANRSPNEMPVFQFQNFIYHLPKLQLKDVQEIIEKFDDMGKTLIKNIDQFTPKQLMNFAAINTLYLLLLNAKEAFSDVMFNHKFQDLAIDSDQLDVQPQFHEIINKINCLFYLVQNKLFVPYIPAVFANPTSGKIAASVIKSIEDNSTSFHDIAEYYMKNYQLDLFIFDENMSTTKLLRILGRFKKQSFKIFFKSGKSSYPNVIYIGFDNSGQICNYISIKSNNKNIFKQVSQLMTGFPIHSLVYILEIIYNKLFVDESVEIPLVLDEQSFPNSETRFKLCLDNLWYFGDDEESEEYSNINKICGCLYGNGDYPKFFFTGVMRLFFNLSFVSLSSNNYESFVKWISWLNKFLLLFISNSKSFSLEKDQFISEITQFLSEAKSDELIENIQNAIYSFPYSEFKSPEIDYIIDKLNESIAILSSNLEDSHLNELKDQKKREIERNFILIKRDIATKIGSNRDKVIPLQSLLNSIKDIEHTEKNFNIINNIVNSIIQVEEEKNRKFGFRWPNQNEAPSKSQPDEYFILKTLLDYSAEINQIIDIQSNPTWMKLCQMQVPNSVLIDYLRTEKISKATINILQKRARVKFIIKLMGDDVKTYLTPNSIRIFLNEFYNRFKEINNGWVQIVQELADKYPPDYLIYLPKYEPTDLLALLVDPFTSIPGPLLSNEIEYNDILSDFFNLYNGTFKNFSHMLVSIQNNYQQLSIKYIQSIKGNSLHQLQQKRFKEFYSEISNLPEIPGDINELGLCISKITEIETYIENQQNESLIYDDIFNLNGPDYMDNNPVAYFYLSLFPSVKEYLKPIENFKESYRFPLALLGFRVMSRSNCIQMQLPMSFQTEKISSIVSDIVCEYLNKIQNEKTGGRSRSQKSSNFHNAIGFLIENPPRNIETNYTGHFRSALITVMSFIKNETLFNMVQDEICKILPHAIEVMLSDEWKKMVTKSFDPNNDILMFMRNPWSLILNKIQTEFEDEKNQVIEHINMMISFIINGTNDQITENTKNIFGKAKTDEENYVKENAIELLKFEKYFQENEEDEETKEVRNYWKLYNIHLLNALGKIHNYDEKFQQSIPSDDLYVSLAKHFENATVSFPTAKSIPILLVRTNDRKERKISITVIKNKKYNVVIKGTLNKGITLFKLNGDIKEFEFKHNDKTEYKVLEVKYDPQFQPIKTFKLSIMESNYEKFAPICKRIQEKTSTQDLSKFSNEKDEVILNDDQDISSYVETLNDVKNRWTEKLKDKLELNKYPTILDEMNSDILTMRSFYPPKFRNGRFRQPIETLSIMRKLMDFLNNAEVQITKAKEELSKELLDKDNIFTDSKSEFNKIQNDIKGSNNQIFPQIVIKRSQKYDFKSKNGEKIITEDLLAPSITSTNDKNKPFININEIDLNIGPLMSGIHTTPLRFRMVNFESRKFNCIPEQNDPNLPIPTIESKTGFFIISIPIEELNVSLDKETDILFDGNLHFKFEEENKDFAIIPYKINLHFKPPTIYLQILDHKFAIKNGKAEIADFYCSEGSIIELSSVGYPAERSIKFAIQIVEQIDNTAARPHISSLPTKATLTIPSKKVKEDLFSSCLNIIFSSKLSAALYFKTKIEDSSFVFALFDDTQKDFVTDNAVINFGILEREVYFLISWMNPNKYQITPTVNINVTNDKKVNLLMSTKIIRPFKSKKLENYIYNFTISSANIKITQSDIFDGQLTCGIDKVGTKIIKFKLVFKPVSVLLNSYDHKINIKYDHNYPFSGFYGNSFIDITKPEEENIIANGRYQLVISPFSYSYFSPNGEHCRIYYKWNGSFQYVLTNGLELYDLFDVLCIDEVGNVFIDGQTTIKNDDSSRVKLFAILKRNRQVIYPLFGKNSMTGRNNKPITLELNPKLQNMGNFLYFFGSFLGSNEKQRRNIYHCQFEDAFTELTQQDNFGYFIDFFGNSYNDINFLRVAQNIDQYLGYNNYFYIQLYNAMQLNYQNKKWEFMSFIEIIYKFICNSIDRIEQQNEYTCLPIPIAAIKSQQQNLLQKIGLDRESIENNSKLYQSLIRRIEKQDENQNTVIERMKKDGYKVSDYVKWSYSTGFAVATQKEINEMKKTKTNVPQNQNHTLKLNTTSAYLVNPSLIDIPVINNNISLAQTFNSFNQYLKAAYQFPFSLYSSIEKNESKLISESSDILNKLYSIFSWSRNELTSNYSVFKQFINDFSPAFTSLLMRLEKSKINVPIVLSDKDKNSSEIDFLISPQQDTITMTPPVWQQIGLLNDAIPNMNIASKQSSTIINLNDDDDDDDDFHAQKEDNSDDEIEEEEEDKNEEDTIDVGTRKKIKRGKRTFNNKYKNAELQEIENMKLKINRKGKEKAAGYAIEYADEEIKEMSNQELINTLIEQMINEREVALEFQDLDLTQGESINYSNKNDKEFRIKTFLEAAEYLSKQIISSVIDNEDILNNSDNVYASILIECTTSMDYRQKAFLIILTIAYANALTALKIPYALMIFGDPKFHFIMKKLDEKHDEIHFQRLLDMMTIIRRFTSMHEAVHAARENIKHETRKNHAIFVLSDGLSRTLHLTNDWQTMCLDDENVSVSFFFLNIIKSLIAETDSESLFESVKQIWDNFSIEISDREKTQSPSSVYYDEGMNVFKDPTDLINQFIFGLSEFPESKMKDPIPCLTWNSIEKVDKSISESGVNPLLVDFDSDTSFYYNINEDLQVNESLNFEPPMTQLESFTISLTKSENHHKEFLRKLSLIAPQVYNSSSVQSLSSYLFVPNKPSQYSPSVNGTIFYFPGLVKFLLTHGQDTKIFLEKNAGFIMSYSVFVVIDCTVSSFNPTLNENIFAHSVQSVVSLLMTLSHIDLPSINIIITTKDGPALLCSDVSTLTALSPNSPVWVALFDRFMNPHDSNHIISALSAVLTLRMQQKTSSACCFIFSDGNYNKKTRETVAALTNSIEVYKTTTITIGIGDVPKNTSKLTRRSIWCPNPKYIVNGINFLFGNESTNILHEMKSFFTDEPTTEELFRYTASLVDKPEDIVFDKLHDELNKVIRPFEMFQNYYNAEQKDIGVAVSNPEGEVFDLGKNRTFNSQQVLFCMFWDSSMNERESPDITKNVLKNGLDPSSTVSAVKALKDFGMKVKIVQDYEKAIHRMMSGEYTQVHIICGRGDGLLPNKGNANLVGQFVDCCIQYWKNGGGLVWWADNEPLCYELNLFLENVEFTDPEDSNKTMKTNLRIVGNHYGDGTLRPSSINDLSKARCCFDENRRIFIEGTERPLFNFNLVSMYEGITVSFANDPTNMAPFKPFAVSSDGGVSIMYYNSDKLNQKEGDIVIDCGFSKLFRELSKEGIYRYIRNIAVWILSLEKRELNGGSTTEALNYHPEPFTYNIRPYEKWDRFIDYNYQRTIYIAFLIDGTKSMRFFIESVRKMLIKILRYCNSTGENNKFLFGCIIYRDYAYTRLVKPGNEDKNEFFQFSRNIKDLEDFLGNVKAKGGGGDYAEDWLSGYQDMLSLKWNTGSKIVIHIGDAPGHGTMFSGKESKDLNMDLEHDEKFPPLVEEAARRGILFHCICGDKNAKKSFYKTKKIYEDAGGKYFKIEQMNDENLEQLQDTILQVVKKSVDAAIAIPVQ